MMKTQTEKLALVDETTAFFNSDNRCFDMKEGMEGCKYYLPHEAGCAIGRKIEDKKLCKRLDLLDNTSVSNNKVFCLLPKDLQEYGQKFLTRLQDLHDQFDNWDLYQKGLSTKGKEEVKALKDYILRGLV